MREDFPVEGFIAIWTAMVAIILVVGLVVFVVNIFFILTLQNTMKLISPENQKMRPGQVWLLLIPLFNLVWIFFVIDWISQSIRAEMLKRGQPVEEKPTYTMGLIYAIGSIVMGIVGLIFWIIYWVQVNEYKNKLSQPYSSDSKIFGNPSVNAE